MKSKMILVTLISLLSFSTIAEIRVSSQSSNMSMSKTDSFVPAPTNISLWCAVSALICASQCRDEDWNDTYCYAYHDGVDRIACFDDYDTCNDECLEHRNCLNLQ